MLTALQKRRNVDVKARMLKKTQLQATIVTGDAGVDVAEVEFR